MRSTHCGGNTFDPNFFVITYTHTYIQHTHTRVHTSVKPGAFRGWHFACFTGQRRCDLAGQVTRRLQVSQCLHTIEFLAFSVMFEIEEQQFPLRSGVHHPEPIEKESGGHNCLVYICSKQENMQRFDSQKNPAIVQISMLFFIFSCWSRNTPGFCCNSLLFLRHYQI